MLFHLHKIQPFPLCTQCQFNHSSEHIANVDSLYLAVCRLQWIYTNTDGVYITDFLTIDASTEFHNFLSNHENIKKITTVRYLKYTRVLLAILHRYKFHVFH